jgi:hypothetical protein
MPTERTETHSDETDAKEASFRAGENDYARLAAEQAAGRNSEASRPRAEAMAHVVNDPLDAETPSLIEQAQESEKRENDLTDTLTDTVSEAFYTQQKAGSGSILDNMETLGGEPTRAVQRQAGYAAEASREAAVTHRTVDAVMDAAGDHYDDPAKNPPPDIPAVRQKAEQEVAHEQKQAVVTQLEKEIATNEAKLWRHPSQWARRQADRVRLGIARRDLKQPPTGHPEQNN